MKLTKFMPLLAIYGSFTAGAAFAVDAQIDSPPWGPKVDTHVIAVGGGDGVRAVLREDEGGRALRVVIELPWSQGGECPYISAQFFDVTDGNNAQLSFWRGTFTWGSSGNIDACVGSARIRHEGGVPGTWIVQGTVNGKPWIVMGDMKACLISATPMLAAEHTGITNFFYTINQSEMDNAIGQYGYQWRPSTFAVERVQSESNRPFRRFMKGAPQNEHFYTISDSEAEFVRGHDYIAEGHEGWIYAKWKPNTFPLRRWSRFNGATGDLCHFYSANGQGPPGEGWQEDPGPFQGAHGWVCKN